MSDEAGRSPFLVDELPDALDSERIDRVVALLTGCSRSEAVEILSGGEVTIDGAVVTKASSRVASGDRIVIGRDPHREPMVVEPDAGVEVDVVHADDDVIVVNKAPGLVVHPGSGHKGSTLVHGLLARYPDLADVGEPERPGLVHRLDRGTSGLMVVARTQDAYEDLVDQLVRHSVERVYTALVWRHLEHQRGVIDAPIGRSRRDPLKMTVALDGRESRTHYEVDAEFHEPIAASLLTCRLETGRTHQIRVHLSSISHPVVGDPLYGGARQTFPLARPFLHARRLMFVHPGTGEEVHFDAPLPADLSTALDRLS